MNKILIALFLLPSICFSQTVTLDFVVKSKDYSLNELAEKLVTQFDYQPYSKIYFIKNPKKPGFRSVDYSTYEGLLGESSYVEFTFHAKPYDDYENLERQIKSKFKKTGFFFCNWFDTYITEYESSDGGIIYLWQNKPDKYQEYENYNITVSWISLKGPLFKTE